MSKNVRINKMLTDNQKVAVNTAIMILERSNSDHAEQACFYLKQIVDKKENKNELQTNS